MKKWRVYYTVNLDMGERTLTTEQLQDILDGRSRKEVTPRVAFYNTKREAVNSVEGMHAEIWKRDFEITSKTLYSYDTKIQEVDNGKSQL